jgi:hypothetical protein
MISSAPPFLTGSAQQHFAGDDAAGALYDAQQRLHRDALAAARLAHDAEHLARIDVERHAVDRANDALVHEEVDFQVPDGQQRIDWLIHVCSPITAA